MKKLRLARLALLVFLTIGFASCNKDNNGNNTNDEIIEYQGEYPAPQNIEYVEDGVTYEIEAIPGQVVISTDEDYYTVVNAVTAHEGKIIEQYPQYGLYTVEVVVGNENAFVATMNDLNISAELNLVEYPKERYDYFVFDDYADANGVQHGRKVSNILSECQNDAVINEINNVIKLIIPLNYTNFLLWNKLLSQDMVLVNWSHGYGSHSADWQNMTPEEKSSYKIGWKKEVMRKLDQIIRLKKKNPNIDIVFAKAAGNERCPETDQMINDIKANPKYKKVLEENFILVSDYSSFANTSSSYGDFCYIKEHPYFASGPNGGSTSFASPQALCYINQVINGTIGADGKNITAVQALAAVKAAIRQNSNGELDLDEALEMARIMYSPGYFTGTPFDKVRMIFVGTMNSHKTTTITERVGEYSNQSGTVIYHNETHTEEDDYSNNIEWNVEFNGGEMFGLYGFIDFINDSIIIIDIVSGNSGRYKNGVTYAGSCYFLGNPYYFYDDVTFVLNRSFENHDTFSYSECFNWDDSYQSSDPEHSYIMKGMKNISLKFHINTNSNICTYEEVSSRVLRTIDHGSHYTGTLLNLEEIRTTINGTWEKIE